MSAVHFTVPGDPRGKGRPRATVRGGFASVYTDAKTASYENLVALSAKAAMGAAAPMAGAVVVSIVIWLCPPKSASKRLRTAMLAGAEPVFGRFDIDNICKAVLDGSNSIVFADDRQIIRLRAEKRCAETPGVDVTVSTIGGAS